MRPTWVTPLGSFSANPPAVLVGAGDIADCGDNHDEQTAALLDGIEGTVFTAGDNAYERGSDTEFQNCYNPTWGRHKARTRPSPGNRDYDTQNAAGYYNYFGAAAGERGKGYYSYDLGDWHIVALNNYVSMSSGSAQDTWLKADLAATTKLCRLAYYHEPLYSSINGTGSGGTSATAVRPLFTTLYNGGMDVVLNGHRHFYERLAPMNPDGKLDTQRGIREFIVGTGGASIGDPTNAHPLSEVRFGSGNYGVFKLYLYSDGYAWRFVPVPGRTLSDTGSTACHGAASGVSASTSTVTAEPATIPAGGGSSTITVTVKNANGAPISGATVVLAATGSGNTLTQPASPTDANGVATGSVSSTVAGTRTVSATANGTALSQTAQLTVTPGPVSASASTVTAAPSAMAAGSGTATITVTAKDPHGNPISGATVVLAATGSENTLTQPGGPTDANGVAAGGLSSTVAGIKTVSATVNGTALAQTAQVTVTAPVTAVGITHTLLAAGTSRVNQRVYTTAPIAPAPNTLITVGVLGSATIAPPSPTLSGGGMTGWTEVASVTFDQLSTPRKRLTIFRAMSAAPGNGPLTITFSAALSNCQWIVSQWAGVDLSGVNGAGAIRQTGSSRGDAVNGLTVPLAAFGNPNNMAYGVFGVRSPVLAVTPVAGFTEISEQPSGESPGADLQAEWKTNGNAIAASWIGRNGGALGLEINVPVVDASQSTVTAEPISISAGSGSTTMTVTAKDASGNPISGATVVLAATGSGNTLTQPASSTDANGVATGRLSSTVAGMKTVSATANGIALTHTAEVTVTPGPVSASASTVAAAPASIEAGGAGGPTSTITVMAKDAHGNAIGGATVVLAATGSGNTLTQPAGQTDANGVAAGTLRSTVAEPKTVSATIDGTAITQTAAVTVTPGPVSATQSTVTASPTTIAADTGVSTITVTARDANGNRISGATVALAATGSGNTVTQPAGPTNANGVATGTLRSTVEGTKTISATANGAALTQTAAVTVQTAVTITHTLLTVGTNTANQRVYPTAPIAPAPNTLVTVAVLVHSSLGTPPSPTLSGGGMTAWTEVASVTFDTTTVPRRRLTIFRALSAAPGSGPITITSSMTLSHSQWVVSQWEGVETSGVNGAGAIVQTGSSRGDAVNGLTVPLAAFGNAKNVAYGAFGVRSGVAAVTPGAGFTEIAEQPSGEGTPGDLQVEWATNRSMIVATWTTLNAGALGVEIQARRTGL